MTEIIELYRAPSIQQKLNYWSINYTFVDEPTPAPMAPNLRPKNNGSHILAHADNAGFWINFGQSVQLTGNATTTSDFGPNGLPRFNPYYGRGTNITYWQLNVTHWFLMFIPVELGNIHLKNICTYVYSCSW